MFSLPEDGDVVRERESSHGVTNSEPWKELSFPKPFCFGLVGTHFKFTFTSVYSQMHSFRKFSLNRPRLSYPPIRRAQGATSLCRTLYCYLVAAYTHSQSEIILQGLACKTP